MTKRSGWRPGTAFILVLIVGGVVSLARAQQIDTDEKKAGKYSIDGDVLAVKPKSLCVCLDPGLDPEFDDTLGLITRRRKVVTVQFLGEDREVIEVKCRPIAYDPTTGARDTTALGCTDWVPLAK